jgi:hypothetical protein
MKFNFDIFGIKAKRKEREARRLAEAQAERQRYQERKRKIDDYLSEFRRNKSAKEWQKYEEEKKKADEINATCPMCHSSNVVHKVVRTKGEVHGRGSSHSFSSGGLFNHYSSSCSDLQLDGSLDTLPVNKCNDCGHEWNIMKAERRESFDPFSSIHSDWVFHAINKYIELDFDPYDKTEQYNSLEEKQDAFIKKESSNFYWDYYREMPRYVLDYVVGKALFCCTDKDKAFKFGHGDDEYSYVMPDAIFEVLKKLTKMKC